MARPRTCGAGRHTDLPACVVLFTTQPEVLFKPWVWEGAPCVHTYERNAV